MDKQTAFLHSVIEVDKDVSVRCQAPGCTATVWKAIHVVVIDGEIKLYGSTCFKKAFLGTSVGRDGPAYGSGAGRMLTDAERLMLQANTQRLLEMLEEEHREEIDRLAKLQALENEKREQEERELELILSSRNTAPALDWPEPEMEAKNRFLQTRTESGLPKPDAETKAQILTEAKDRFRQKHHGCNPDQPGWVGLVKKYEADILKERGYSS